MLTAIVTITVLLLFTENSYSIKMIFTFLNILRIKRESKHIKGFTYIITLITPNEIGAQWSAVREQ